MDARSVVKVTLSLTKEVLGELDRQAELHFGDRKGTRSLFVEMLLRNHFKMNTGGEELKDLRDEVEK